MPIPFGKNTPNDKPNSNNNKNGVVINEVIIRKVLNVLYDEKLPWMQYSDDIGLNLELNVGRDFYPKFYVGGNWKRNSRNEIVGYGSSFKINLLLRACGFEKVDKLFNDECELSQQTIDDLVGRKFLRLSYARGLKTTGKIDWKDWQQAGRDEEGQENFLVRFFAAVEEGHVKDFDPNVTPTLDSDLDFPPADNKSDDEKFAL